MRDENSAVSTETLASPRELSIDEAEMVSGGFHWHFNLGRFDHAVGSGMIDGAVGGAVAGAVGGEGVGAVPGAVLGAFGAGLGAAASNIFDQLF